MFYADNIDELEEAFDNNCMGIVTKSPNPSLPFVHDFACYRFVDYDPYYDIKVANEQGKVIQGKHRLTGEWIDITAKNIDWLEERELRVKPEETKPVTHRELALWLVQGNGQIYHYDDSGFKTEVKTYHSYHQELDNSDCNKHDTFRCKIRKWGDTEWVTPTRENMGLED